MSSLAEQLHALRIPPELHHGSPDQLEIHITGIMLRSLNSISPNKLASGSDGQDPLTVLDLFQDSLAYLYVLWAQIQILTGSNKKGVPPQSMPGGEIWQKIARFVPSFDPIQMRYSGRVWLHLVDNLVNMAGLGRSNNISATGLLAQAMLRLDPSGGTLTTTHLDLVRVALESTSYRDALPVLNLDIHSLARKAGAQDTFPCSDHYLSNGWLTVDSGLTEKLDRNAVQEYYLLGAMVYIGVRNWDRAKYFLEHVLSTPMSGSAAATGMMLEAYRKWILVSLMAKGEAGSTPKAANSNAIKNLRSLSKHHEAIADAFKHQNRQKLMAEADAAAQTISEERNMGLLQQVIEQFRKLSVRRLGDIYAAVPLQRVALEYNQAEAAMEQYLQALIAEGYLKASIENTSSGKVLRFAQGRTNGVRSEVQSRNELLLQQRKIEELAAHVSEADRRLALSKEYVDYTVRRAKSDGRGPHDEGVGVFAGRAVSELDEDENMMTE